MNQDSECIFCKIARGEIPCYKVYEDELCIAFLDINPSSRGHTLVLPKEHVTSFVTCPKELLNHLFDVAQIVAQAQIKQLGATGVNIISNVGKSAGQSVNHFHIHVIPRYDNDGLKLEFKPKQLGEGELLRIQDSIQKGM
jgi:histidine triad (HIT) family protein